MQDASEQVVDNMQSPFQLLKMQWNYISTFTLKVSESFVFGVWYQN